MKKIVITVCLASSILYGGGCKGIGKWKPGAGEDFVEMAAIVGMFVVGVALVFSADCAEFPSPTKIMLLKNGDTQFWYGEEKSDKGGSWVIKDGKIKVKFPDSGEVIYEIQPNGDLRCVEEMREGEVTAIPMEMQYTLKRTNSLFAPQNN